MARRVEQGPGNTAAGERIWSRCDVAPQIPARQVGFRLVDGGDVTAHVVKSQISEVCAVWAVYSLILPSDTGWLADQRQW